MFVRKKKNPSGIVSVQIIEKKDGLTIAFVAYKVYKELERRLKEKRAGLSPEKTIEIAKTIYRITVETPKHKHRVTKNL